MNCHKAQDMIRSLRSRILVGELVSGELPPPIPRLGEEFHLTFGTVQRGLKVLSQEG